MLRQLESGRTEPGNGVPMTSQHNNEAGQYDSFDSPTNLGIKGKTTGVKPITKLKPVHHRVPLGGEGLTGRARPDESRFGSEDRE